MAAVLMIKTAFTCLTYAIVIGNSFSRILHFFGLSGVLSSPAGVLIVITLVFLLPLVLQKSLALLSYSSALGIFCEVFVVLFMQVRYWDGSYTPEGAYFNDTKPDYRPDFSDGGVNYWGTAITTFVLLGALSTAYIAHYNAPKFYGQMENPTPERFTMAVTIAFFFALAIYMWIMVVGYLTFGKHCSGLILDNYAVTDGGATAARIAITFAVSCGFPLAFTQLRDSTISVFGLAKSQESASRSTFLTVTLIWLLVVTTVGCLVRDLGLVNSLGGALLGSMITMVFPGLLCYLSWSKETIKNKKQTEFTTRDAVAAVVVIGFGIILLLFGSAVVLLNKFTTVFKS